MRGALRSEPAQAALNAATVTSFAIVQPLLDLLGRAPEFLVAHQASRADIVALTIVLAGAIPLAAGLLVLLAWRIDRRAGHLLVSAVVGVMTTLLVLVALAGWSPGDGRLAIAAAALTGVAGALAYARLAPVRIFLTWLAPGLVVFPLLFVFGTGIRPLVLPHQAEAQASHNIETPVVMVVFDQLPLWSLLGTDGKIDRELYPSFAGLADDATWYRNATTVSDFTRWALPSVLTGRVPTASSLPVAAHYPSSIFTLLGASHRMHVFEPITAMCPASLCERVDESVLSWLGSMVRPLATTYLHAIAPADLASALPAIDQGWNEQSSADSEVEDIDERWYEEHRKGRRDEVLDFIGTIGAASDGRPPFHFLHVLLPHEPYIYTSEGQRYTREAKLPGLMARQFWRAETWPVDQGQQRYLLQLGYVDRLLGQLIAKLKAAGLYNQVLLVVTSDHGASFRAGLVARAVSRETYMDILPIPLLIKRPHQTAGVIDDRSVESIDIVPTMADILEVPLAWRVDGVSMQSGEPRDGKRVFYDEARKTMTLPSSILEDLFGAAARRHALFGDPSANPSFIPATSPARSLIGRPVGDLRVEDGPGGGMFTLDLYGDLSNVDPRASVLPAYLAGTARAPGGGDAELAFALNGQIVATTRTYPFFERRVRDGWTVILPPPAFRPGRNDLEIFLLTGAADEPVLRRVHRSSPDDLDLSAPAAVEAWGVTQEGFHDNEWRGTTRFRWTRSLARVRVPLADGREPAGLRVMLLMSGRNGKPLRVEWNGCELYDGVVPAGRWSRDFDLSRCPPPGAEAVIELRTEENRGRDRRDPRLFGVAVQRIDLLDRMPQD